MKVSPVLTLWFLQDGRLPVPDLSIPAVEHRDVRVRCHGQHGYSGGAPPPHVPPEFWQTLEGCLATTAADSSTGNWLEGPKQVRASITNAALVLCMTQLLNRDQFSTIGLEFIEIAGVPFQRLFSWSLTLQVHDHEEYNPCVVGEDVAVEVTFRNPLKVCARVDRWVLPAS